MGPGATGTEPKKIPLAIESRSIEYASACRTALLSNGGWLMFKRIM